VSKPPEWVAELNTSASAVIARILRGAAPPCEHRSCHRAGFAMCFGVAGARLDMIHAEDESDAMAAYWWPAAL
jgi:hypothetical protein